VMATNLNSSRSNVYRTMDSTVNVNTISDRFSITVYPNPSNGIFSVTVAGGSSMTAQAGQFKIEIYNVLGEKVYNSQISNLNTQYPIDLRKQAKGVYNLKISTDEKVITKKIVIE